MSAARDRDLTPLPDLLHGGPFAGPVRTRRPVYVDLLPPCNDACPAGEDIQGWLAAVRDKDYARAFEILTKDNPLPAVMGRVCYHPCEDACNRCELDDAVSIHAVERFIGDEATRSEHSLPITASEPSGKKVLVIGAGPSGLSAAYHLARRGHQVEVRDAGAEPGGMMRYGIPAYRLPREVLAVDIKRIADLGVTFTMNHKVTDLNTERDGFDAVFAAVGAHASKHTEIPARDAGRIIDAVPFLREVAADGEPVRPGTKLGRLVAGQKVAVYGGGNTAMDAARTAKRLGADEALIVYRRNRDNMPAHEEEAAAAETEGVRINWLRTIADFEGPQLHVEVMELDESGYPRPTGRMETLTADTVILALGQDAETGFLTSIPGVEFNRDGTVVVDSHLMTGCPGLFAGGDMTPAERTVTVSVGHGKKAARNIDDYLRGIAGVSAAKHPLADFAVLHPWYFAEVMHNEQPERVVATRTTDFREVVGGLSERAAIAEAQRCLSCGNCFECDGCFGACPEEAVVKLGQGFRYEFDYDRCTGCGICYEQCPVHAIELTQELEGGPSS
jgi:NADPH-dependent glutamate synthase beta subunit-like oxidoreductase